MRRMEIVKKWRRGEEEGGGLVGTSKRDGGVRVEI